MDIRKRLFDMQNIEYREFHSKLMPTIAKDRIIGITVPNIRKLAKEISDTPEACQFLAKLPHGYYEENNLHAFLIEQIKDFDNCIAEVDRFLPYVDNWATCDSLRPKCFKLNTDRLLSYIYRWISSDKPYTVRFGIEMLMLYYLDDNFNAEYPQLVSKIKSEEYYVNMMIAWYFATALAKQYDSILPFLTEEKLSVWVHNKTIRKACESLCIPRSVKLYLKTLIIK